jgi:hypothetical protein
MRKILFWIVFVLGIIIIFSAMVELFIGNNPERIVSGFIGGAIFLFFAKLIKYEHQPKR